MSGNIEIKALLPHREPFLFIDEVKRVEENEIETYRLVRPDEFYFAGHFPGNPILPGVLMVEAIAQTGIILALIQDQTKRSKTPLFAGIEKVRFYRIVRPGEQLRIIASIISAKAGFYKFSGRVFVEEELACEAIVTGVVR